MIRVGLFSVCAATCLPQSLVVPQSQLQYQQIILEHFTANDAQRRTVHATFGCPNAFANNILELEAPTHFGVLELCVVTNVSEHVEFECRVIIQTQRYNCKNTQPILVHQKSLTSSQHCFCLWGRDKMSVGRAYLENGAQRFEACDAMGISLRPSV